MKPAITSVAMLLLGTILGFILGPALFRWLASALGAPLMVTSATEAIIARSQFALACGVFFVAAPISSAWLAHQSRPALWACAYLALGCAVSIAVAAFYHSTYSSAATELQRISPMPTAVLFSALPTLRIPLIGASAILCLGLFHGLVSRSHARFNP